METEVVNEISASHDREFVDSNIWLHLSFPQLSTRDKSLVLPPRHATFSPLPLF